MNQLQSPTLDGLPKQFVVAMRTLFDIMDDKKTGYVRFTDIEHRWQDDGTKGLPKGVIDSLQKVTPPNGMLSFERFCAGLKICLLRNQVENTRPIHKSQLSNPSLNQPNRPPSAPLLDIETTKPSWVSSNTATVRPNNAMPQQRTLSMPQLLTERKENTYLETNIMHNYVSDVKLPSSNLKQMPLGGTIVYGPPKPPRTAVGLAMTAVSAERNFTSGNIDKAEIRTALQNWQMGLMLNDEVAKTMGDKRLVYPMDSRAIASGRGSGDGKPSGQQDQVGIPQKKNTARRREPRRHTLQNGIDYNMLKRMKQIEQEKEVLMLGLNAIDRTRDWYVKQVTAVQEKMKYLGRMGSHLEHWTEAQQERLELQRARVLEVNRHLATLTNSWERGGFPLHMNLAFHNPGLAQHNMLGRLKQQNHLLTEEVSKKSERITALEREKTSLIRELFINRPQNRRGNEVQEDVPFM